MPNGPRPAENTGSTATRTGATVGAATVLGTLLAPHVPNLGPTEASLLVGIALGGVAALTAALGKVARDQLHEGGSSGLVTRLLATLFVLPLVLFLGSGCASQHGPDGSEQKVNGDSRAIHAEKGCTAAAKRVAVHVDENDDAEAPSSAVLDFDPATGNLVRITLSEKAGADVRRSDAAGGGACKVTDGGTGSEGLLSRVRDAVLGGFAALVTILAL